MPLPALAGIPWLVGVLSAICVKLIDFVAQYFTRKVAVKVVFVGIVVALLALFVGVIEGLVAGLVYSVPTEIGQIIYWVTPSNTSYCVSAIITAKIARWIFDWHVKLASESLPS